MTFISSEIHPVATFVTLGNLEYRNSGVPRILGNTLGLCVVCFAVVYSEGIHSSAAVTVDEAAESAIL